VLGCFTALALSRRMAGIAVFEKQNDLCAAMTKANTAVVYAGYDIQPGTKKAELCVRACRDMDRLCAQLGVTFSRPGSLMVATGPAGEKSLREKYAQGQTNGTYGLRLIDGDEARRLEPALSSDVTLALFCASTGTLNPWEFGLAAARAAFAEGAEFYRDTNIDSIIFLRDAGVYRLRSRGGREWHARAVVNACGIESDLVAERFACGVSDSDIGGNRSPGDDDRGVRVQGEAGYPGLRILPNRADYLVLDTYAGNWVKHIVFQENEDGKGVLLVPTVLGNLLVGPSALRGDAPRDDTSSSEEGLAYVRREAERLTPGIPLDQTIRSFAGLRPVIVREQDLGNNGGSIKRLGSQGLAEEGFDFSDLQIPVHPDSPCFISLIGIKTPGLTCANEIGKLVADMVEERCGTGNGMGNALDNLRATESGEHARGSDVTNQCFPKADNQDETGECAVVCRCRQVTEVQIRAAVRGQLGARSISGVKRRTGAGSGRCQGGYCTQRVIEIIAEELSIEPRQVPLEEKGSEVLV